MQQITAPLELPLLLRDIDPLQAAERLRTRLEAEGVEMKVPRKAKALNGVAMIDFAIKQQENVVRAVCGEYPETVYGDELNRLRRKYPALKPVFDTSPAPIGVIKQTYQRITDAMDLTHPDLRALDNLYRAWGLWRWVEDGKPVKLSLTAFNIEDDAFSFTPVVYRAEKGVWQLGEEGDIAPVSPKTFKGNRRETWLEILATYADWKKRDAVWWMRQYEAKAAMVDHCCLPFWAAQLRKEGRLQFGNLRVENLSHGNLLRFRMGEKTLLVRSYPEKAIRIAAVVSGGFPLLPLSAKVMETVLLGGETLIEVSPLEQMLKPLSGQALTAYQARGVSVAWLMHPKALAIISGEISKLRAVLLKDKQGKQLGIAPFSFKTRKPDMGDLWGQTPTLDARKDENRRMLSIWALNLWLKKVHLKKYQL